MAPTHLDFAAWLDANPDVANVKLAIVNLNGVFVGKRLPASYARKALDGDIKLPFSAMFMDIWGRDAHGSGHVLETGDCDGLIVPTGRTPVLLDDRTCLIPMRMLTLDRSPYPIDPRNALAALAERYGKRGLTPVCALELEFYLCDRPAADVVGWRPRPICGFEHAPGGDTYGLTSLDRIAPFLDDLYRRCEAAALPVEAAVSEGGRGQFEINLGHCADVLRAADDAVLFKEIVKQTAFAHDMSATFMAKPFGDDAGNGLHIHFSLLDGDGRNAFANGTPEGAALLRHAVAGALDALPGTMLFFAPHANSYRRFLGASYVSPDASWGYENRTAALRIPAGPDAGRRFEHRIAGADANPYLALAAMLGAALVGIEGTMEPPPPVEGNAARPDSVMLPRSWHEAIGELERSAVARAIFGDLLPALFAASKRQELDTTDSMIPQSEIDACFAAA